MNADQPLRAQLQAFLSPQDTDRAMDAFERSIADVSKRLDRLDGLVSLMSAPVASNMATQLVTGCEIGLGGRYRSSETRTQFLSRNPAVVDFIASCLGRNVGDRPARSDFIDDIVRMADDRNEFTHRFNTCLRQLIGFGEDPAIVQSVAATQPLVGELIQPQDAIGVLSAGE